MYKTKKIFTSFENTVVVRIKFLQGVEKSLDSHSVVAQSENRLHLCTTLVAIFFSSFNTLRAMCHFSGASRFTGQRSA